VPITIVEEPVAVLPAYGRVSIAFLVESQLRVEPVRSGLGGLRLVEQSVDPPYVKDYDREKGQGPERWLSHWDLSNWGVLSAFEGTSPTGDARRVGAAELAWRTARADMLERRQDLRVRPEDRGRGIGSALFTRAIAWARERACQHLKIETGATNVPACRFYARQGCALGTIRRWAYPDAPHEVQLFWYLTL
jgi:GNAT superfamily N-acetyltransferase